MPALTGGSAEAVAWLRPGHEVKGSAMHRLAVVVTRRDGLVAVGTAVVTLGLLLALPSLVTLAGDTSSPTATEPGWWWLVAGLALQSITGNPTSAVDLAGYGWLALTVAVITLGAVVPVTWRVTGSRRLA